MVLDYLDWKILRAIELGGITPAEKIEIEKAATEQAELELKNLGLSKEKNPKDYEANLEKFKERITRNILEKNPKYQAGQIAVQSDNTNVKFTELLKKKEAALQANKSYGGLGTSDTALGLKATLLSQSYGRFAGKGATGAEIAAGAKAMIVAIGLGVLMVFFIVPAIIGMLLSGFVSLDPIVFVLGFVLSLTAFIPAIMIPKIEAQKVEEKQK